MNRLTDKALLLLYTLGTCLLLPTDALFVSFFFFVAACSCSLELSRKKWLSGSVIGSYCLLTLLFPSGILFCPLIFYDCLSTGLLSRKKPWILLPAGLLFCCSVSGFSAFTVYYLLLGTVLGGILQVRSSSYEALDQIYRKTRDDSFEYTLLLKEKNRTLMEKQNYEIYAATLKERNRIAREIHDHVGHMLSRAILMTGALKTVLRDSSAAEPLSQLEDTLNTAMNNIRESVHDLHDEAVNLRETAENLVADFHSCPVSLEYDISCPPPPEVRYCMIAVLKEGLSNISVHSHASEAWITLREHPAMYQLIIRDNGTGAGGTIPEARGIGLSNMRERVEALNGSIHIQAEDGFRIFIAIPKQAVAK